MRVRIVATTGHRSSAIEETDGDIKSILRRPYIVTMIARALENNETVTINRGENILTHNER